MKYKIINSIILILILLFFKSCGINPSTGKNEIILMSEKEEDQIGINEHPKILKQFGGVYDNEKIQNYVESLGKFLVSTSELPNKEFKFTILNTPIINAFALPGGYIYLTRGLISLCQNEAQLAGVIAHEIGHVTARHTAKRYTKTVGTSILANVFGVLANNPSVSNLINQSASLYLLSFSRGQEYEADLLATRYMIRAGFDPKEMGNFLEKMEKYSLLQKKIFKSKRNRSELLQTHPNSSKRVKEVIKNTEERIPINPIIGEEVFLKKIDGITFGHKEDEGFFINNKFIHKPLGISFSFDEEFYFINNPKYLIGVTENETKILFDVGESSNLDNKSYMSKWAKKSKKSLQNCSSKKINIFNYSTCMFSESEKKVRLFMFRGEKQIFRFVFLSNEKEFQVYDKKNQVIINSFQEISNDLKIQNMTAPKVKIISKQKKENFLEEVIEEMSIQPRYSSEIFNIINGLYKKNSEQKKIKTIY